MILIHISLMTNNVHFYFEYSIAKCPSRFLSIVLSVLLLFYNYFNITYEYLFLYMYDQYLLPGMNLHSSLILSSDEHKFLISMKIYYLLKNTLLHFMSCLRSLCLLQGHKDVLLCSFFVLKYFFKFYILQLNIYYTSSQIIF